jgi:hypothetical protein
MLGYDPWESWCIQQIPCHFNKVTWYSAFWELRCCQICSQAYQVTKLLLGQHSYHCCLHSYPTIHTRKTTPQPLHQLYQPANFVIQKNVLQAAVKCPIAIFCCGSIAYIKEFLLHQVSEFTVFHICIRCEKYPYQILVVDHCSAPGKRKMCLSQITLSYKECICAEIKFWSVNKI